MNRSFFRKKRALRRRYRQSRKSVGALLMRASRVKWIRMVPLLLFLCVFIYSAARLIDYAARSHARKQVNEEIQALHDAVPEESAAPIETPPPPALSDDASFVPAAHQALKSEYQYMGASMLINMRELYAQNRDLIGWVRIPSVVNLPVVYGNMNYYLTHNFYGKEDAAGCLFLDSEHPFTSKTQHLLIHGHSMFDGSMFGLLTHYRKADYAEAHPYVFWSTLYREETYEVFAVLIIPSDPSAKGYVPVMGASVFYSEAAFDSFIEDVRVHALYFDDARINAGDALLSLSTCLDDDRIVVMCRRMHD